MSETKTIRGAAAAFGTLALGALAFLSGHGCGSVSNDRQDAINQATTAACNRYQACGLISNASTASYATISDCQSEWNDRFTKQWTQAQCQGRIDKSMLNVCIEGIDSTSCTSVLDVLNTFYVTCSVANVCDVHDAGTG